MRSEKNWPKKVANIALTVVIGTVASFSARKIAVSNRNYIDNAKIMPKVASELNVDTHIMKCGDGEFDLIRLKPNLSKKVYVYIDKNVPDKARNNITRSLDKFNYLFDNINDDYNLEVCNYDEYLANKTILNSTIKFEYKTIDNNDYGKNATKINKTFLHKIVDEKSFNKNLYVVGSTIYLNKTYFEKMNDLEQQNVINHELLHSFGFNDTYNTEFDDETSLMNPYYTGLIKEIGPNDLKLLYLAYGKKHINNDESFNQEKMNEVKNFIYKYEDEYYKKLISFIKNETKIEFQKLSNEDIQNFAGKSGEFNVKIDKTGETFSYKENIEGKTGTGRIIKGEDYVILPDIVSKNYKDFLILLKNKNGIKVYNLNIYYNSNNEKVMNNHELSLE